jgi:uncharacterized protein (TIGR02594 family)
MIYSIKAGDTLSEIAYALGYRGHEIWQAVCKWTEGNQNIKNNGDLIFARDTINLSSLNDADKTVETRVKDLFSDSEYTDYASAFWMEFAKDQLGVNEIRGGENQKIVEFLKSTTLSAKPAESDETPWCSAFVNWVLEQAGFKGTDNALAESWANWGRSSKLEPGAIVVIRRWDADDREYDYHVGFYVQGSEGNLTLLGGNQSNSVKYSTFGSSYEIFATRMPK